jgi:hypothetical protein
VRGGGVGRVGNQLIDKDLPGENVNPHRGADFGWIERRTHRLAVPGLFFEPHDPVIRLDPGDPELVRVARVGADGRNGDIRVT